MDSLITILIQKGVNILWPNQIGLFGAVHVVDLGDDGTSMVPSGRLVAVHHEDQFMERERAWIY